MHRTVSIVLCMFALGVARHMRVRGAVPPEVWRSANPLPLFWCGAVRTTAVERTEQLTRVAVFLQKILDNQESILALLQRPATEDAVPVEPDHQKYVSSGPRLARRRVRVWLRSVPVRVRVGVTLDVPPGWSPDTFWSCFATCHWSSWACSPRRNCCTGSTTLATVTWLWSVRAGYCKAQSVALPSVPSLVGVPVTALVTMPCRAICAVVIG